MIYTATPTINFTNLQIPFGRMFLGCVFGLIAVASIYSQTSVINQPDDQTIIFEEATDSDIYSFGKNVVVKKHAKSVLAFGGDVIIEGTIEGDVGTIGGSIIQKEDASIGGDVIIFAGTYRPESKTPLRNPDKETVMIAAFEEEFRNLVQNPSQIFAPSFSISFLAQRILSVFFWFIVSLALTTLAPGAVSRAITRFQLSTLKVFAIGFAAFWVTTLGIFIGLKLFPNYLTAIAGLMAFVLLMLGYVFGRVALQVSVGKQLQKRFLPDSKHSETLALLLGALIWTFFLSIPYLWIFALIALIAASLGLVLTARSTNNWQKAA